MHDSFTIHHPSGTSAKVAPGLGFNCYSFVAAVSRFREVEVLAAPTDFLSGDHRPSHHGIPILFPFPNRITAGRYEWAGREYQMPLSPGHPDTIHGFALDRPWRVTARSAVAITGEFQLSVDAPERLEHWPADCRIEVTYEVREAELLSQIRIHNSDTRPLPWGFGTHAYFRLPLFKEGDLETTVQAPAYQVWELNECIPTGRLLPPPVSKQLAQGVSLRGITMDDVFTDLRPAGSLLCEMTDAASGLRIVQECDPTAFRELVVYTPPNRPAVCMEPYTCVTDAMNLAARGINSGWRTLAPGESFETWIKIRVEPC